jgi:hypothetical protein
VPDHIVDLYGLSSVVMNKSECVSFHASFEPAVNVIRTMNGYEDQRDVS